MLAAITSLLAAILRRRDMTYVLTDGNGAALKYPYGLEELRRDNPNTSFPSEMGDDALASWNVFPCAEQVEPAVSDREYAERETPALVKGVWTVSWSVKQISDDDWALKAEYQWSDIRAERNAKLAASDWTQLSDAPVDKSAWAAYRQALRDITQQDNPFTITWPVEPA